ncbi:MAG: sugar phosphate isomerase/epimerase [Clostridia bacterium]|nr:sugar phosphate isomerase/epimerase [Clostridia bacterium]
MQAGVSTASLFLRENTEDALPLLEALGVKTAEVFLTSFSEYGYPFADILKEKKGGLLINSVHDLNTNFEPQLFAVHPRVREDAFFWLKKVLDSANALGAPYYTFHGTARMKRAARMPNFDNFPRMIEGFARILEVCRIHGVGLCLENVEWATYNRPSVFKTLAQELPDLRGVLDIKQARISGYPYEEYLTEMGDRLAYAHVSDIDESGKMCLPGKGGFDFDTLVKRLKDVGFDGALLIEAYAGDYQHPTELKESCTYLEEILYKNNVLSK